MNTHIELVKKWLADPDSVTPQELLSNADTASDISDNLGLENESYYAVKYDRIGALYDRFDDTNAVEYPEYFAAYYADSASHFAAANDAVVAAYWVTKYEELTA